MRKVWQEFKSFAFKGNMIDLAIAVVIGAAFGDVIKSMVANVIMPLVNHVKTAVTSAADTVGATSQPAMDYTTWHIGQIKIGAFIGDMLNFLIIAAAVFFVMVKLIGTVMKAKTPPAPSQPTTKECPCACR
jgi:large conductance mechanosensitive channel